MSAGAAEDAAFLTAMRDFSRLYARRMGFFRTRALGLDYSLPEGRILIEIGRRPGGWVANQLAQYLAMDRSYMTRLLNGLEKKGRLRRAPAEGDARKKLLYLTEAGAKDAEELERRSDEQIRAQFEATTAPQRRALLKAVDVLEKYWDVPK